MKSFEKTMRLGFEAHFDISANSVLTQMNFHKLYPVYLRMTQF